MQKLNDSTYPRSAEDELHADETVFVSVHEIQPALEKSVKKTAISSFSFHCSCCCKKYCVAQWHKWAPWIIPVPCREEPAAPGALRPPGRLSSGVELILDRSFRAAVPDSEGEPSCFYSLFFIRVCHTCWQLDAATPHHTNATARLHQTDSHSHNRVDRVSLRILKQLSSIFFDYSNDCIISRIGYQTASTSKYWNMS